MSPEVRDRSSRPLAADDRWKDEHRVSIHQDAVAAAFRRAIDGDQLDRVGDAEAVEQIGDVRPLEKLEGRRAPRFQGQQLAKAGEKPHVDQHARILNGFAVLCNSRLARPRPRQSRPASHFRPR